MGLMVFLCLCSLGLYIAKVNELLNIQGHTYLIPAAVALALILLGNFSNWRAKKISDRISTAHMQRIAQRDPVADAEMSQFFNSVETRFGFRASPDTMRDDLMQNRQNRR